MCTGTVLYIRVGISSLFGLGKRTHSDAEPETQTATDSFGCTARSLPLRVEVSGVKGSVRCFVSACLPLGLFREGKAQPDLRRRRRRQREAGRQARRLRH